MSDQRRMQKTKAIIGNLPNPLAIDEKASHRRPPQMDLQLRTRTGHSFPCRNDRLGADPREREAPSPPTAPASTPRAISRVFTPDPIRHTYAILYRTLLDR